MGGLGALTWRLTVTPSEDLKREESEEITRRLAQFGSQAGLHDFSTLPDHAGDRAVTVGLQLRSIDAQVPLKILSPVEGILGFLGARGYRWSFWIDAYGRNSFYDVRREDVDIRAALLGLVEHWDSGGKGVWRWTADGWSPVDLGSSRGLEPKPGVLLVDYRPGDLNYTEAAVPTSEIISLFASTEVEAGSLSQPPRRWTGKGGAAAPGPIEITLVVVAATAAATYAKGFLDAAGKDSWEAVKRGIKKLRENPRREVRDATVSIACQVGGGWILFQGPSIDEEALAALDSVGMPALPAADFEWVLEWEPELHRWVLLLDRYMPNLPE